MFNSDTDKEWEKFGRDEPYYGVLTSERFRRRNFDDSGRTDFFASGERHVDEVLRTVRRHLDSHFSPTRVLDFGCGVGRLTIPLANVAEKVTGVDVSPSMLAEARKNCDGQGVNNVDLLLSDDYLSQVTGRFDFIHSFIVFQHISPQRGMGIFRRLVALVEEGGVGAIHFTYGEQSARDKWVSRLKNYLPYAKQFANLARGRAFLAPEMQMYRYDLSALCSVIQGEGAIRCHLEFTDHGVPGAMIYFKKGE